MKIQPGIQLCFFLDTSFTKKYNNKSSLVTRAQTRSSREIGRLRQSRRADYMWAGRVGWCTLASDEDSRGTELQGFIWVLFKRSDDEQFFL